MVRGEAIASGLWQRFGWGNGQWDMAAVRVGRW